MFVGVIEFPYLRISKKEIKIIIAFIVTLEIIRSFHTV
jgi:hypothetical protein